MWSNCYINSGSLATGSSISWQAKFVGLAECLEDRGTGRSVTSSHAVSDYNGVGGVEHDCT